MRYKASWWFQLLCLTMVLLMRRAVDFVLPLQPTSQETSFPCHPFLAWSLHFICCMWGGRPRLLHVFASLLTVMLLVLRPEFMRQMVVYHKVLVIQRY